MLKILATFRGKLTDASIPSSPQSFRLSGAVLAIGSFILLIGTLLYLPLGPTLGLPTNQSAYPDAFNTALHMGRMMQLAGCISFLGDTLILVASLALLGRRELAHGDFERICWSLLGVGFAIAMIFDSLMGTVLGSLATMKQHEAFLAFKTWFDFLFAAGNIFVVGACGIFWVDRRSTAPLLPGVVDYLALLVSALAVVGGLGYVLGIFVSPLLIGGTIILLSVALMALGVQMARRH